jgi:hypothetical protein
MKKSKKDLSMNSGDPTAMNNDEVSDNRFIQNKVKDSIILDNNDSYSNLSLVETFLLRYSDPVNTICLTDNYLLFGSMIGKAILYNISKKHFYQLYDLTNENIMGTSLENKVNGKSVHYLAIGDESVVSIVEKENEKDIEANTIYTYEEKNTHNINCNESFTLLWKNKALIINLAAATEYNEEIEFKENPYLLYTYEIEDKRKDLTVEGKIEMSNYSVPFDFKDNIFLFLEHHPKEKRAICTYEFIDKEKEGSDENQKEKKVVTMLEKNFGHISFIKILNKNLILLVRNYNLIEVYEIENEFKKISFYNHNSELNAIDFYEVKGSNEDNDDNIINASSKLRQYNIIFIDVNQNIVELKLIHEMSSSKSNKFEKMEMIFRINVNDIGEIDKELKLKGLFNLDFPYYIKNSPSYVALTTDQACFLFKKEK